MWLSYVWQKCFATDSFFPQIVHLSGQVDDLVELETDVVDRLHLLLSSLEKRTHPRKPYKVNIYRSLSISSTPCPLMGTSLLAVAAEGVSISFCSGTPSQHSILLLTTFAAILVILICLYTPFLDLSHKHSLHKFTPPFMCPDHLSTLCFTHSTTPQSTSFGVILIPYLSYMLSLLSPLHPKTRVILNNLCFFPHPCL